MRFIVTAGPTREYLDDVRFISNASSGRMGYAVARAALRAGHTVHLITGPVALKPPPGADVVRVTTTREMYLAAARLFPRADCLVGAAAPADYTPARRAPGKRKKTGKPVTLRLHETVDIVASLARRKGARVVIAFALETRDAAANARKKLKAKRADAILVNAPAAMGAQRTDAALLTAAGEREVFTNAAKDRIARRLVALAEDLITARRKERRRS